MADIPQNGLDRLDSWKAIAVYLQRDERTVRRWEREQGLPVRRVPGGRGTSVFAYVAEIDAWLKANQPVAASRPSHTRADPLSRRWRAWAAAALIVIGGAVAWRTVVSSASDAVLVEATPTAFIARDAHNVERWRHRFPSDERAVGFGTNTFHATAGRTPSIFSAVSFRFRKADDEVRGGQVFHLTPRGDLRGTFSLDDAIAFRAGPYGAPWAITDLQTHQQDGRTQIAVAAHHYTWWPSVVTVLGPALERGPTFVHAGWIEEVRWLSPTSLLVFGYSEAHDGGVAAMLDTSSLAGQGPVTAGSPFECVDCGAARPVRYVVMPRSEVNRAAAARFNRAKPQRVGDRLLVRTVETDQGEHSAAADAIYEFTRSLDLVSASFSSRYWQIHRELEAQGKLDHTREECPDRNGPREIQVWEPATGWRTVARPAEH